MNLNGHCRDDGCMSHIVTSDIKCLEPGPEILWSDYPTYLSLALLGQGKVMF